jgi:CheY-like chemotaxis protein
VHEACSSNGHTSAGWADSEIIIVDVDTSLEYGLSTWHHLRRNPMTIAIPAVFLVEAGQESLRRLARMAGATVCLDKPFRPRHLQSLVQSLVGLSPRENAARESSSFGRPQPPPVR